jgi:hypothetical protein
MSGTFQWPPGASSFANADTLFTLNSAGVIFVPNSVNTQAQRNGVPKWATPGTWCMMCMIDGGAVYTTGEPF